MCGIFAYKGFQKNAPEIVIKGLRKLEYRGYDSWGITWSSGSTLNTFKQVGKISEAPTEQFAELDSQLAISHSRWATHGRVTQENAHPHWSPSKKVCIVHNGVIENYQDLRNEIEESKLESETDTEVVAHLIEQYIESGKTFVEAFNQALEKLEGKFAIVAISSDSQSLVGARRGSPLILGRNAGEFFLASDIPAFLDHTQEVNYIDDNEMVLIDEEPKFYSLDTKSEVKKNLVTITWTAKDATKGDYDHFMLKEIMDQKDTIHHAINQSEEEIMKIAEAIKSAKGVFFAGCGTAGKVCMAAEYFFSVVAKRHVNFTPASEFPIHHHFLTPESLLIVVSQSGETMDTMEAMEAAKSKGSKVLSIVNVEGSSIARQSDFSLLINAGPEKAVASTKAATSQLALLLLIAFAVDGRLEEGKKLLIETAANVNDMLNPKFLTYIKSVAETIQDHQDCYIIGKAANYPTALEAAIKIQECSYVNAQGFAGGELKHGPIALITEGTPCISLVANDEVKKDIISNTFELKARGAHIIGIAPERNEVFNQFIRVPDCGVASPIVNFIPVQVLAYYLSTLRGLNPDMPRNLAKSVTVK
jgi:glutamine---fructose-6-phosphate transaminase (isomerizing)